MTHLDKPISVLLIEDDPGDAKLVQMLMARMGGIHPVWKDRLSAGLAALAGQPFDLCLLDLSLPDSHGLSTVRAMVAAAPRLPVVVLTSLDDDDTGLAAVHAGAEDYMTKAEMTPQSLRRAARYAIERRRNALALMDLGARQSRILETLGEGVVEVDGEGVIRLANPAAEALLGSDLVGRRLGELDLPDQPLSVSELVAQAQSQSKPAKVFGLLLGVQGSQAVCADVTVTIGGDTAVLAIRDHGDRLAAYEGMRLSLVLEQELVAGLPLPAFTLDPLGHLTACSRVLCGLLGCAAQDLLGQSAGDVLPDALAGDGEGRVELGGRPWILRRQLLRDADGQALGALCTLEE